MPRFYVMRVTAPIQQVVQTFARAQLSLTWHTYFNTALFPAIAGVRWTRRLLNRADGEISDFERGSPGRLNDLLTRVFAAERHLMGKVRIPIGVSLLAVARLPRAMMDGRPLAEGGDPARSLDETERA